MDSKEIFKVKNIRNNFYKEKLGIKILIEFKFSA